jgi:delta-60 repeat domain
MKNNHTQAINSIEIARRTATPFCFLITAIIILVSLLTPHRAEAAAGDLDPRFGNGGVAITDFAQTEDYAYSVAVQADGKIVVSGQSGIYPDLHSALVRYNRNGRLDSTFGTGGKVVVTFDSTSDYLDAVALQSDGKIVAAGSTSGTAFLLARFNADGSLDQGFGNNGSVETAFGDQTAAGRAIVVQADGKIIVVGVSGAGPYSELNDFALARYNSDGSLDQTFGSGGKVKTHFPGVDNTGSSATSVALQSDGKLVVGGYYKKNDRTPHQFALARYNSNGTLDSAFGQSGKVMTGMGLGDAFSFGIALQGNGRIVLAGYSDTTQDHDFSLIGYTSNGTVDSTFGNGGFMTTDFSRATDDIAYAMTAQSDGKLVVAGRTGEYPQNDFAVARYSSDGQLDQTFGVGGKVVSDFSSIDQAYGIALQSNGRIVLAGISFNGANFDFTAARYLGR